MPDIAIVTDSTADIPEELIKIYQIQVVPNYVIIGGKSLRDGIDISRQEFYEKLPGMMPLPTTAAASSGEYEQLYANLLHKGAKHILSIHCSSLLSGIYNAARVAAQKFGDRVIVIDSHFVSLGLGFQAIIAAEAAVYQPVESVLDLLLEVRRRARVIAMLDTLEYVRRSGRVSWARARLSGLLRIKAFVEVKDGTVFSLGETRTRRKGIERLIELIHKLGPLERLALLHTNAESEAKEILTELNLQLPTEPLLVNVTTAIGAHVGPNGLGVAAVVKS
jgi:fatty acid kinase fatty acid binding subunit